jgi:hypothetical protein
MRCARYNKSLAKPRSIGTFLTLYTKVAKDDIRRNRDSVAARLGFIRRLVL